MMRFRSLAELLKERDKLCRWVRADQKRNLFVDEGVLTPEDGAMVSEFVREMLRDVEQEIAERTGRKSPTD